MPTDVRGSSIASDFGSSHLRLDVACHGTSFVAWFSFALDAMPRRGWSTVLDGGAARKRPLWSRGNSTNGCRTVIQICRMP